MIKVIVERKVKEKKRAELLSLLRQLMSAAVLFPGYISGETLYCIDDPKVVLVIATFSSIEAWKEWEKNPERLKITSQIDRLLEHPAKIMIYKMA